MDMSVTGCKILNMMDKISAPLGRGEYTIKSEFQVETPACCLDRNKWRRGQGVFAKLVREGSLEQTSGQTPEDRGAGWS